jgi:hypothetical protein
MKILIFPVLIFISSFFSLLDPAFAYYDASLGRFIERDPIEYKGGMNQYEYVGDDPLMRTDPNGMMKVCCRGVRGMPGRHCEIPENCATVGGKDENLEEYPIWQSTSCDRKHDDGTPCCKATSAQIQACLKRHP